MATAFISALNVASAQAVDWLMFGNGPRHDGYAGAEVLLTPQNAPTLVRKWGYSVVPYKRAHGLPTDQNARRIYAQPVLAGHVNVGGANKTLMYFGDGGGTFHAIDANSKANAGTLVWARQIKPLEVSCANLSNGIISTAAIDRSANNGRGAVYVAANARVYAWDLATGAPAVNWPEDGVLLPNLKPETEGTVFSGVTLYNGSVYVATSSAGCDKPPYHGSINILDGATGAVKTQWFTGGGTSTVPTVNGGAIWGPGGVSIDTNPDSPALFTATGNPVPTGAVNTIDYYLSIIGTRPDLSSVDWSYKPTNLNGDLDFGSTPVPINAAACPRQLVPVTRKNGTLYVPEVSQTTPRSLYKVSQYAMSTTVELSFGAVAFDPISQLMLLTTFSDGPAPYTRGLVAMKVADDCSLSLAWTNNAAPGGTDIAAPGTRLTSVTVANGLAFFGVGFQASAIAPTPGIYAVALQSAGGVGAGQTVWRAADITATVLNAPIVANGRVFTSTNAGFVYAYAIPGH